MPIPLPRPILGLMLVAATLAGTGASAQGRVSFVFAVPNAGGNPFERDIRARVRYPGGTTLSLPAFYLGGNRFSVRASATERGVYRLTAVNEYVDSRPVPLKSTLEAATVTVRSATIMPFVRVDPAHARRFVTAAGKPYVPMGTNLGWAGRGEDPARFYRDQLAMLAPLGVNWVRIWMAHWGGLNLDWLPEPAGHSPLPGTLDSTVARRLDDVVDAAASRGVYIQLVLQHHGQYSSQVNPNWAENPWNAANPHGFLRRPADFFTSPEAKRLTRAKYRYIVARWGYSPAILAWELFNEVQWVDALRIDRDEAAVAAWHAEMADYIRSIDPYNHPVTTSYEDLESPIWARMDYLQPHVYAASGIAPLRQFYTNPPVDGRPLFYGETGDDNFSLTPAERRAGIALIHPLWASLMGEAEYPAQMWYWDRLPNPDRRAELAQFLAFVRAADLGHRVGLTPFSPAVESQTRLPLIVARSRNQGSRPYGQIDIPSDGSEPIALADVPQYLAGEGAQHPKLGDLPYPRRVAFRLSYPAAATGRVHFDNVSGRGSAARVTVDGGQAAAREWPVSADSGTERLKRPADLAFPVAAGEHVVAIESTGRGQLEIGSIDFGLPAPALGAIGKRGPDFVMLWVWHRRQLMTGGPAAAATVPIPDLPAGRWTIRWWGPTAATPVPASATVVHGGGTFRLETPGIGRFAAVMLVPALTPGD